MEQLSMKEIRKALQRNGVLISKHAIRKMVKRGYTKKDLLSCIWTGERTKLQFHKGNYKARIEGLDVDGLPIVCILAVDHKNKSYLNIVTVFPPIMNKFKRVV